MYASSIAAPDQTVGRSGEQKANFAMWLERFQRIESLEIRWFDLVSDGSPQMEISREWLGPTMRTMLWPKLTALSLININISVNTLQECFRTRVDPDLHADLVGWLHDKDNPLERLYIDNLSKADAIVPLAVHYDKNESTTANHISVPRIMLRQIDRSPERDRQQNGPPWRFD